MELIKRKRLRLEGYDYSQNGAYFITVCIKNRERILGHVVGFGILDEPKATLSEESKRVHENSDYLNDRNGIAIIDKYVIMPNHTHLVMVQPNVS